MNINLNRGGLPQLPPNAPLVLIVPGIGLALLGVVVIANPQLIAYLFGGVICLIGVLLVLAGLRLQQKLK